MTIAYNSLTNGSSFASVDFTNPTYVANLTSATNATITHVIKLGNGVLRGMTMNYNTTGGVLSLGDGTSSIISNIHDSITLASTDRNFDFGDEIFTQGLIVNLKGTCSVSVRYK